MQSIDRLRQHPQLVVSKAEVTKGDGIVGLNSHCLFIRFGGFSVAIKTKVAVAQRVVSLAPIRFDPDSIFERVYGLFMVLRGAIGNTQIEKRVRIVWFKSQRFLKRCGGFSVLATAEVSGAKIVVNDRIFRREFERVEIGLNCFGKIAKVVIGVALILECLTLVFVR